MLEFLSTLFTAWCLYVVWRWLFPGKEVREQRRHLKRERKLGMLYPSEHPRCDEFELRQGIDFKMGGILQWKTVKGGLLLVFKPAVKGLTATVTYWHREGSIQASYQMPLRLHISELGRLCINAPKDGVFEACVKDGEVASGDSIILLHTDPTYIEEWKAEQVRREAEKEAERVRLRHERYLEEQKQKGSMKERLEQAERERRAVEREKAEIAAKLKEKQRRRELEEQVRMELIDSGELFGDQPKRPPIPREMVDAVYRRDGARCVYCGSTENLQLDHIIPFSKGGATSLENLQLLCQKCNLEKSNKIG